MKTLRIADDERKTWARRGLTRVFLDHKLLDYFVVFVLGIIPVVLAQIVGVADKVGQYHGYIDWNVNSQWLLFPFTLPLALGIARIMWRRMLPRSPSDLSILDPIVDDEMRKKAHNLFLERAMSTKTLVAILAGGLILNGWDWGEEDIIQRLVLGVARSCEW